MALESSNGLGIASSYGTRATEGKFGGEGNGSFVKHMMFEVDKDDLASLSAGVYSGLDLVFPIGTNFLDARIVVEQAVVGPTAITIGTYTFNTSTKAVTAHAAEGLMTAAVGVVTALDAVGDVVVGTGALLTTGTGAAFAVTAPVVLRVLPTVAVASAGKFRVYVTYLAPSFDKY